MVCSGVSGRGGLIPRGNGSNLLSPKVKHNKQHDARAASFKRIAKALRVDGRVMRKNGDAKGYTYFRLIAARIDAEAKQLRWMR